MKGVLSISGGSGGTTVPWYWMTNPAHQKSLPHPSSEADEGLCPSQKILPMSLSWLVQTNVSCSIAMDMTDLTAAPLEMHPDFMLVGWNAYFLVAGLKTAKRPLSAPHKEHVPSDKVSTPKSSSSKQTGWKGEREGRTRSDFHDSNCPTTAHTLTSSKATPTPEASLSCWGHWKRKIHGLKSYKKPQSLPPSALLQCSIILLNWTLAGLISFPRQMGDYSGITLGFLGFVSISTDLLLAAFVNGFYSSPDSTHNSIQSLY